MHVYNEGYSALVLMKVLKEVQVKMGLMKIEV